MKNKEILIRLKMIHEDLGREINKIEKGQQQETDQEFIKSMIELLSSSLSGKKNKTEGEKRLTKLFNLAKAQSEITYLDGLKSVEDEFLNKNE